jgi:uncharacterized membrane protein
MEYLNWWQATLLFLAIAAPITWMATRSLAGLGAVRRWVALGMRLLVLLLLVLIVAGARWQRENKVLEVMVLRDISESTSNVHNFPGTSLQSAIDDYLKSVSQDKYKPNRADKLGVISFKEDALIDAPPEERLELDTRALRDPGHGTDAAAAIQLALASLHKDAMHRLLLIWDGNATAGDLTNALSAATAQHVPIDVMPLKYNVTNEVMMDRFVAPMWKRENEAFTMDIVLNSTNTVPVSGKLTVRHGSEMLDLDPNTPGVQPVRMITVKPGLNPEHIFVPALSTTGVHQFVANFEGENVTISDGKGGTKTIAGDTLMQNNSAATFTFVRGKGKVLCIDNVPQEQGKILRDALAREGISLDETRTTVDQFPNGIVDLQNYDAVILANVPRGPGGLSEDQQKMLATYVHDMGGGLVMIGGDQAFGAGGWGGSKLEEVLPVNMDIPAQRQVPKGALVMAIHSCEMPQGNYWGEQCALEAAKTLSSRDEVGVISYAWAGPGGGGSQWDFPLQEKGDGSKLTAAVKAMQLGDMPDFDDMLNVALHGGSKGEKGLIDSDARQKHIIVISDGDPGMPQQKLIKECNDHQISISTITVYTHTPGTRSPQMEAMAKLTKGRAYGPIEKNPNQLPQIFIKEATVVRRSLVLTDAKGIATKYIPSVSDVAKGLEYGTPPVTGLVLTSKKPNPQVDMPLTAGANGDPLLAYWQAGLGKSVAYTSDAHTDWAAQWVSSQLYDKFWAQVVRSVSRPPMSNELEATMTMEGNKAKIVVEALNRDASFLNFMNVSASVVGPDASKPEQVRLVQTGPGRYEAEIDANDPGAYVSVINYRGAKGGQQGMTLAGTVVNTSPELRELKSNDSLLFQVAERTGGRVLPPFDPATADLFTREGLSPTASPLPIWDILIPMLLALMITDVAIRRIAWDWNSTKRMAANARDFVMSFTTTRKVETRESIDALKRVRTEVESKLAEGLPLKPAAAPRDQDEEVAPDRTAKFEAKGVEGDISKLVGGATDKPMPPPPKKIEPKGAVAGSSLSSLKAAKQRAQQKIRDQEKGDG